MITLQKFVGFFINTVSIASKNSAARISLYLFTTPRNGAVTDTQAHFLETSKQEKLVVNDIKIMTYSWLGTGHTILLAHGWESNSARWQYLIEPLRALNYNIIALDAPAHGQSGSKRFNAILYANFINVVSRKFKPDFIIGHSVGGMASVFAQINGNNTTIKKMVLLGTPSEFKAVLDRYYKMMGYSNRTIQAINTLITAKFNEKPENFSTARHIKNLNFEGLIIHDESDGIIPYQDAVEIHSNLKNSQLITTSGFGHSLRDASISNHIYEFLKR